MDDMTVCVDDEIGDATKSDYEYESEEDPMDDASNEYDSEPDTDPEVELSHNLQTAHEILCSCANKLDSRMETSHLDGSLGNMQEAIRTASLFMIRRADLYSSSREMALWYANRVDHAGLNALKLAQFRGMVNAELIVLHEIVPKLLDFEVQIDNGNPSLDLFRFIWDSIERVAASTPSDLFLDESLCYIYADIPRGKTIQHSVHWSN